MAPASLLSGLGASDPGGGATVPGPARTGDAPSRRLGAYVAFLFDTLLAADAPAFAGPAMTRVAALLEDLIADVAANWSGRAAEAPAAALRVRMAEEIMRARSAEPLAMHEVAQAVGVGLRSLQLAFRAVRGEEPRATLARFRLHDARARLLSPAEGDSVTTIALDCGFTHLSRFAEAYRRAFGERPGETLGRRR
jgi:AraC-like DNA-binding protein